ncbi:hypothetical protein ACM66B_000574 [Microbotryomycetes sp. NB124-2]
MQGAESGFALPLYDTSYDSRLHPRDGDGAAPPQEWSETEDESSFRRVRTEVSTLEKVTKESHTLIEPARLCSDGRLSDELTSFDSLTKMISETRNLVKTCQESISELTRLRHQLTGVDYSGSHGAHLLPLRSTRVVDLRPESQQRMVDLASQTSHDILLAYETIQHLKLEFPTLTRAALDSGSSKRHERNRIKTVRKKLNKLYVEFAAALDSIEERVAEETKEVETGGCLRRLESYIAETRPQLDREERKRLAEEAQDQAANVSLARLHPISLARRWALENVFGSLSKTLDRIDRLEQEYAHRQPPKPNSKSTARRSKNKGRGGRRRFFELGKRPETTGDSSDSGASFIEELPYVIPSDDPNGDHQSQKEVLEHFKHKRRLVRKTIPVLVLYWVAIVAMWIYWGVSRGLGRENPLGSVRLDSFLGDGSWDDKHGQEAGGIGARMSSLVHNADVPPTFGVMDAFSKPSDLMVPPPELVGSSALAAPTTRA